MEFIDLRSILNFLPNLIGALVILIVGWILAAIISAVVRGALRRTSLDNRIARSMGAGDRPIQVENGIAKGIYYLIILFAVVAALQVLGLTIITEPLNNLLSLIFAFIPRIIAAGILILIAWILATVLKAIVTRVLSGLRIDERLNNATSDDEATARTDAPANRTSLAETLGDVVYWLVFLFFLPAILGALGLEGLLAPVQGLVDEVLAFLPNLAAAALILVVGWFVARIVQRIVTGLLAAAGVDGLANRVGLGGALGGQSLSGLIGLVVYVLILIPVVLAALNALNLESVTAPVSNMLNQILIAIPNIFAAALILIIAFFVGRLVARLVSSILRAIGFDTLPARLGIARQNSATPGGRSASEWIGYLVLVAIMLFATMEAANMLGFGFLAVLIQQLLFFAGQLVMGLIIIAIGIFLANLAADVISSSGVAQSGLLATIARVAILVFVGFMGLRQMDLGESIVNLAFALTLGAVAVAVALAFGLGGREVAGQELAEWRDSVKRRTSGLELPPGSSAMPPAGGSSITPGTSTPPGSSSAPPSA